MAIVRGVSNREKQRWQDRESRRRFDQQRKPGTSRRRGTGQRGSAFSPFFRIADRLGLKRPTQSGAGDLPADGGPEQQ